MSSLLESRERGEIVRNCTQKNEYNCRVQKISNFVAKKLIESGRAKNEFERVDVKLHMTLMNSRYLAQVGLIGEERE